MTTTKKTILTKDLANKKMVITREFAASRDQVWDAWTKSELLEAWWAPKPWKAVSKTMNFTVGGSWFYYMAGPEGEKHYAKLEFIAIHPKDSFQVKDMFCDENGNKASDDLPTAVWTNTFTSIPSGTKVVVEMNFKSEEDINKMLAMGFQEGFAMAHDNLDELLAK